MLSASAHKFGGPKGVGFLYVDKTIELKPLMVGGGQERMRRSGTENLPAIIGMATALKEATENLSVDCIYITGLRDRLLDGLCKIDGISINGGLDKRLSGNINISINNVRGELMVALLDQYGISVSSGSACASSTNKPSHVLKAIGLSDSLSQSSVRFSLSALNTKDEIDYIINTISEVIDYLGEKKGCWNQV